MDEYNLHIFSNGLDMQFIMNACLFTLWDRPKNYF
jgi:hypothetical protein